MEPIQSKDEQRKVKPPVAQTGKTSEEKSPSIWRVGDVILDRYEVIGILGEGSMGIVYKIYHRNWHRDLAVKSPRPEIFTRANSKENFIREAEAWVNLGDHPYLVRCDFVQILGGIPRIFAEYIDGRSLASWITTRKLYMGGPEQALERTLDVAIQFAWGLHAAHEQGLVHQDVKPANVMMTLQGNAKVTDFGLAKARTMAGEEGSAQGTGKSILVSSGGMTPVYCSPEQAAHRPLSRKTDIWSWGVSVLEMFVGKVTWMVGIAAREALASHEPQIEEIPSMPPEVVTLLSRCFQPRPEDRPTTMLEVATELQGIYARLLGRPYPRGVPKRARSLPTALNNRARSLADIGRTEEALALFEQVIHLYSTLAETSPNKGLALHKPGLVEEAMARFLRLDSNLANAYRDKGLVLQKLGRLEEALLALEQASRFNPTDAHTLFYKASTLQELGRAEEALATFEQSIRLDPTQAISHFKKGIVLHKLGKLKEALVAYEQAIYLDPTDAATYYKGVVLQQLGRATETEQAFKESRELHGRG